MLRRSILYFEGLDYAFVLCTFTHARNIHRKVERTDVSIVKVDAIVLLIDYYHESLSTAAQAIVSRQHHIAG